MKKQFDAIIIGSGPNGFAAAITLAKAGLSVVIYEAKTTVGGGMRSFELTLPGYIHDVCSAIHPFVLSSPFFQINPVDLEWIYPPLPLAHPMDGGTAVVLDKSIKMTMQNLGNDAESYKKLMEPLVNSWKKIGSEILAPFHFPRHPWLLSRFGWYALQSAESLWKKRFKEERARNLFAGLAAHSLMPLDKHLTAAFALVLGIQGHLNGWPFPKGGSQRIADALASLFSSLGGEIVTNCEIKSIDDLPKAKLILCDITPKQLLKISKHCLPNNYKQKLEKFRYGPGIFKIDWALSDPIPWKAEAAKRAGTLHIGGSANEIVKAEKEIWQNRHPTQPFVILAQHSLFDTTRAPLGKHTAWGYCHTPSYSDVNMTEYIENQIERFAPGFKDCILARNTKNALEMELDNPNYVGGDINGGVQDVFQLFSRPAQLFSPYSTPVKGLYLCSSSTPPGGGVHGMCGYYAALQALKELGWEH